MVERSVLVAAVIRVAEESFFAWTEPVDIFCDWPLGPCWRASVGFEGPVGGELTVVMPDAVARQLYAAFLGLEPDAPIDDAALQDCVGEFANMSCGAWLTAAHPQDCFVLRHPEVRSVRDLAGPPPTAVVMIGGEPVAVAATLT